MVDYQPIDISKLCNAGVTVLGEGSVADVGPQSFRGLPFLVGPAGGVGKDHCFISLDGAGDRVVIPVRQECRRVIVAHRLVETSLPNGGPVGVDVAEYIFHLSDGASVRVPLRERFEIGNIDIDRKYMRGEPFIGVPDQKDTLHTRYEGRPELAGGGGRRQMESDQARAKSYYLWTWENPNPDCILESIEVTPSGPHFVIAGITLGYVDEHPFSRQGRRPVRIVLTDSADAQRDFNLDVKVDRGNTTYAYPLPVASAAEFLEDPFSGWGEEQNTTSSPIYAEIGAIPSATVRVKIGEEEVGSVKWGDIEEKGSVSTPRMRVELVEPGKNWVHVKVLDDDTGLPVPCRVHFRSPDGVPYQPHGHHNHVNSNLDTWHTDVGGDLRLGQITYAYIDGTCQGWLPRGEVIVDVARGFEYSPLRTKVQIEPGQQELSLRIKRWINMNEKGWFSGDSHVHFLSAQGSHTESQGEDLNVVNLLQSQWGGLFTNIEDFTGAPSVSQMGNNIVYVGQENRQHFMGHMILWGLKRPVMPWCSDGPGEGEMGGSMETSLAHWADEAHAQGGFVINPHFPQPNGEPAALIATGRLDGIEMIRQEKYNHSEYYRYLNCGYRVPLIGGTDKMSSDVPVGLYRTYVHLTEEEEFNYENWCNNVAKGRTFLSGGPIIHFSVDGHEIGDTVQVSGPGTVEVEAWADSNLPMNRLEIVQAGRVVASAESSKGTRRLELKEKLRVDSHTWLAARCGGPGYFDSEVHYDGWRRGVFAHTSPVYVACGGDWWMFDKATAQYMLTMIEGDLSYIRQRSSQDTRDTVTHHHGENDHLAYLERPFHEARQAVEERLKKLGITL